jgi:hypothetical protein
MLWSLTMAQVDPASFYPIGDFQHSRKLHPNLTEFKESNNG